MPGSIDGEIMNKQTRFESVLNPVRLNKLAGYKKFVRGVQYYKDGHVLSVRSPEPSKLELRVVGENEYMVKINTDDCNAEFYCTCPSYDSDGFCKHCVAGGTAAINEGCFETINPETARSLVKSIGEVKDSIGGNPGVELFDEDDNGGEAEQNGQIRTASGFRYISIRDSGYVIWGKKPIVKLLQAFDQLSVKEGYSIDGYYYCDGMGGNFQPVAFQADMELPDWNDPENNPVFTPDAIPKHLDKEIELFIIPSGAPESYFQKSLFMREIYSHGAFWHGCGDWSLRGVVTDRKEFIERVVGRSIDDEEEIPEASFSPFSQYDLYSVPELLYPKVTKKTTDDSVQVCFYFYTQGLGATRGLFQVTDTFTTEGSMATETKCVIDMGQGPIP
jgi:hypothetical protein